MLIQSFSKAVVHYETLGNPPADLPLTTSKNQIKMQLEPTLKCIYAVSLLLIAGFTLPKLSLLFLYLRVFVGNFLRAAIWSTIAIVSRELETLNEPIITKLP